MADNAQREPILKLANIYKAFGGVQALAGADFELYPGEIHALVGENGAGKSTMVKVITGVHQIDAGEILFGGEPVTIPNPQYAQRLGIAAIYQEATVFPDLDVAENIFMGHHPVRSVVRRITWRQMYEQAAQPLRDLGVDLDPRTKVRGLTVAQLQMVEIAKALSFNAQVLVMDEPTSALTLNEVADLFRIAKQLRDAGTAIIFISHRLDEVFELADRVTVLRDGHYVGTRDVAEVSHGELIHMMVGRTLDTLFPKLDVEQGETILRVEGLTRPGAFEDVGFELKRGEILGLAGLVGARRTDVARAIFGVEPAESGTIWVNGQHVSIKRPKNALVLGIAYVPEDRQRHGLLLPMNITRNVTLPILQEFANLGWLNEKAEARTAGEFANQLEVRAAGLWQRARELSGGNQQKVVLAKWLATRPQILILDEPTRGIDVGTKAAVHELMSKLAAQGMAILMISSELPEILGMSDRILVMCEGRVTGHFSRAEATQENIMTAATARTLVVEQQPVMPSEKAENKG
jgi:rhamnose transport system ATP-binding protein